MSRKTFIQKNGQLWSGYQVTYFDPIKLKRVARTFARLEDAEKFEDDRLQAVKFWWQADLADPDSWKIKLKSTGSRINVSHIYPEWVLDRTKPFRVTHSQLITVYLVHKAKNNAGCSQNVSVDRRSLNLFKERFTHGCPKALHRTHAREFRSSLLSQFARSTAHKYLGVVRSYYRFLHEDLGIVDYNPFDAVKIEVNQGRLAVKRLIDKYKQSCELIERLDERSYEIAIIVLAAFCGLKLSEILGLTQESIDIGRCVIIVNGAVRRNGEYRYYSSRHKSRYVPMPAATIQYYELFRQAANLFSKGPSEHWRVKVERARQTFGIDCSLPQLRDGYACFLIDNGIASDRVANFMGLSLDHFEVRYKAAMQRQVARQTDLNFKLNV